MQLASNQAYVYKYACIYIKSYYSARLEVDALRPRIQCNISTNYTNSFRIKLRLLYVNWLYVNLLTRFSIVHIQVK